MTRFSAHENAPHGAWRTNPQLGFAALQLGRRRVGQVGTVTFACVDHQKPASPSGIEHNPARFDRNSKTGYIIAERFAEATRLEEIALHVDDDKRGSVEVEPQGARFGLDGCKRHGVGPAG
jgi:hypothetical protein